MIVGLWARRHLRPLALLEVLPVALAEELETVRLESHEFHDGDHAAQRGLGDGVLHRCEVRMRLDEGGHVVSHHPKVVGAELVEDSESELQIVEPVDSVAAAGALMDEPVSAHQRTTVTSAIRRP